MPSPLDPIIKAMERSIRVNGETTKSCPHCGVSWAHGRVPCPGYEPQEISLARQQGYQEAVKDQATGHDANAAYSLGFDKGRQQGYREGVKEGEGTKNGTKRYLMGFEDGKQQGAEETLDSIETWARARLRNYEDSELKLKVEHCRATHSHQPEPENPSTS